MDEILKFARGRATNSSTIGEVGKRVAEWAARENPNHPQMLYTISILVNMILEKAAMEAKLHAMAAEAFAQLEAQLKAGETRSEDNAFDMPTEYNPNDDEENDE